ncbi:hypothetical protein [Staphylococcus cohnii]|uniref:hypothetical protein n=1 Tax=Staphylococcus cohnii TaxID=29382 RepID=UPI000CD2707D|nr:hypothetical protein [Staphylococcus cohnii]MCG2303678.1 hypothetical protein [Staphylococcus epidermidis]AYX89327.1 hypothetical protein EGX68_03410 [Staphylococcus cohnii]MCI2941742.1 hypothetical protein [Staphylococcus cohnii]PNZ44637.1 hypothetical protein CD032_06615 [Staphylococcus cohnii subsp. cohnii]SUM09135.1 Uncharacterised protein [Staphylococcus cohnii]
MNEETLKIKYTIEYERQYTFPAKNGEPDNDVEHRISNHMITNLDDYTDENLFRDIIDVKIIDRGY